MYLLNQVDVTVRFAFLRVYFSNKLPILFVIVRILLSRPRRSPKERFSMTYAHFLVDVRLVAFSLFLSERGTFFFITIATT